jgi:alkaline phosphatase D
MPGFTHLSFAFLLFFFPHQAALAESIPITHGPILGSPGSRSVAVWARTASLAGFDVVYGTAPDALDRRSPSVRTLLEHDNTGVVQISDLEPHTRYYYKVRPDDGGQPGPGGSFRTLRESDGLVDPELNPKGLFNFKFEFGCGNAQRGATPGVQPLFETMVDRVAEDVSFAILNGDFIYETDRDYTPEAWREQVGISKDQTPRVVNQLPTITGVWENYKTYLSRGASLAEWHRSVPSYFTIDDHETLNDVYGSGTAGFRARRAVFRDIVTQAWYDYLAWSNPRVHESGIHFGRGVLSAGSDVLTDEEADFTALNLEDMANLHVHWGGARAGENLRANDEYEGDPNAGVYEVVEVIGPRQVRIHPPASTDGRMAYSIGRRNWGEFRVANCDFYLLDTRSYRDARNLRQPDAPGISMLGKAQYSWLVKEMKSSDADFHFVVSTVNFMIPHTYRQGRDEPITKGEAWTVFLDEREKLFDFWDELPQRVFLLSGDLHNSFVIRITDNVWEFASGPHSSGNHTISAEGHHPASGIFDYGPRPTDIRWSTYVRDDVPGPARRMPHYCVVQVNNVFDNPLEPGAERLVAFEHPQIIFQFYDGNTGELKYAESVSTRRKKVSDE